VLRPGFEPGISDSKGGGGLASPDSRFQIPTVASSPIPISLTTNAIDWDKYKQYLYANLRPNTARLALKYGKKYSYVLERMDIKDLLVLAPAKQRHIMKALEYVKQSSGSSSMLACERSDFWNLNWSSTY
jgi:hypothetical protein